MPTACHPTRGAIKTRDRPKIRDSPPPCVSTSKTSYHLVVFEPSLILPSQQIVVERNDQGEYTGLSYDLHFIEKLFERGKKSVKEALHAAQPKNEKLETTITTKIDQIEQQVLNKLGAETLGSKYSIEKVNVSTDVKPIVRSHTKSRHSLGRGGLSEVGIKEEKAQGPTTPASSKSIVLGSESMTSTNVPPRTNSGGHRPVLGFLGRKHSKDNTRGTNSSLQSPKGSPAIPSH